MKSCGHQDNIYAVDVIKTHQLSLIFLIKRNNRALVTNFYRRVLRTIKTKQLTDDQSALTTLALTDWLLDNHMTHALFKSIHKHIDAAIAHESTHCRLQSWSSPRKRYRALRDLQRKLSGKKPY